MFGRAAMTLGIDPHSSLEIKLCAVSVFYFVGFSVTCHVITEFHFKIEFLNEIRSHF